MKFYDASRPLYLEADASGVSLRARLLQVKDSMNCRHDKVPGNATLHPIAFTKKNLLGAECCYHNIEYEALGILNGLEKFHHFCFAREVHINTHHKLLGTIRNKEVAILCQQLQCIILCIHQYRTDFIYKPGSDLYITEWLSRNNHTEDKDQEITGMNINANAISTAVYMPVCTLIEDIEAATCEDGHLQKLTFYLIHG